MKLEQASLNLMDLLDEVMTVFRSRARDRKLDLRYTVEKDVPEIVVSDSVRIKQVLINLLGNAIKFTREGAVGLTVKMLETGKIEFCVWDTGMGIPKAKLKEIFEAYQQADMSTTRTHGGTGLGLAICKRLVTLLGGEIEVRSQEGKGSEFIFAIKNFGKDSVLDIVPDKVFEGSSFVIYCEDRPEAMGLDAAFCRWGAHVERVMRLGDLQEKVEEGGLRGAILDLSGQEVVDWQGVSNQVDTLSEQGVITAILGNTAQVERLESLELDQKEKVTLIERPVVYGQLRDRILRMMGVKVHAANGELSSIGDGNLKILVAEDNVVNQRVIVLILKKLGFDADVARTGIEAVEKVKESKYDLVLMDLHMPEMDGLEAARKIKEEVAPKDQPLLYALTASATTGDKIKCFEAGMSGFLTKPVNLGLMKEVLRAAQG